MQPAAVIGMAAIVGYLVTVQIGAEPARSAGDSAIAAGVDVATFNDSNQLVFPHGTDRWIVMGTNIGSDYSDEAFDPKNPGNIGVVQMEPRAYDYLLEHGRYADGTMFLLSFYETQVKPEPELNGFVQGALSALEIHLIDRRKYEEGRAFFLFEAAEPAPSTVLPAGNECVRCHNEHGEFDGTFTQFYPAIRHVVGSATESASL